MFSFSKTWHIFIYLLVLLLFGIYHRYYNKYNLDYQILQTKVAQFKSDTLYEKYPLVIEDRLVDKKNFIETTLKYYYTSIDEYKMTNNVLIENNHKNMIIYNSYQDSSIYLINPIYAKNLSNKIKKKHYIEYSIDLDDTKNDKVLEKIKYIEIKLKKDQILIIPNKWIFQLKQPSNIFIIDDIISKIMNSL